MDRLTSRTSLLAGLCALALAAGCTTAAERRAAPPEPGESFARTVTRAAGIGLDTLEDVEAPSDGGALPGRSAIGPGQALGIANIAFGNPVIGLLGLVGGGSGDRTAEFSQVVAFAPMDYASSSTMARSRFFDTVVDEFTNAIDDAGLAHQPELSTQTITSGSNTFEAPTFTWRHADCSRTRSGGCSLYFINLPDDIPTLESSGNLINSTDQIWRFEPGGGSIGLPALALDAPSRRPPIDEMSVYLALSERLPEWAFVYVAPGRIGYRNEDGALAVFPVPAVLNQGRMHFFVEGATRADGVAFDPAIVGGAS